MTVDWNRWVEEDDESEGDEFDSTDFHGLVSVVSAAARVPNIVLAVPRPISFLSLWRS